MAHCCYLFLIIFVCQVLSLADARNIRCRTTYVVDQSGKGDFTSVSSAIQSVPSGNKNWVCIYVNAGVYMEKVAIPYGKEYIALKGAGIKNTKIVWSDNQGALRDMSTLQVEADNFLAKSITFVNSYNFPWNNGNSRAPAPAAFVGGDMNSFYNCAFYGLQDTLFDAQGRHFFSRCMIAGAVDFIFGSGQSVYQDSTIHVLGQALAPGLAGFITASGRDSPNSPSWFIFNNCKIVGHGKTYLGRPWRPYARVLFYKTYMSDIVVPMGWAPWRPDEESDQKSIFSEYQCVGPGSGKSGRVPWETELSEANVEELVSRSFIDSDNWIEDQPVEE